MKRSLFSVRLYLDGIRQLRITGILFTILLSFVAAIRPILAYLETFDTQVINQQTIDFSDMNLLLPMLFCFVAPIMTLQLFSFLNKRESSDFYHAIPETRLCLFFSFFAAVMTWVIAVTLISSVVATLSYVVFPDLYLINYSGILPTCFTYLAGALLVAASVAIAMSLTGTFVTNVLVSLMLIFLPRLLLQMVMTGISTAFPLVQGLPFAPLLSYEYNVPVGFVFRFFGSYSVVPVTSWQSGTYTLLLGILYTLLAAFFFNRRNSEAASRSAASKGLQVLYRFLIGFAISSAVTYGIFCNVMDNVAFFAEDVGSFVIIYVVALLAALTYEVLCTRQFRGLLKKALFTAALLVVTNLAFFGSMYWITHTMKQYSPDAFEVDSVRIISDRNLYDNEKAEYFLSHSSEVELTNITIRGIVCDQLDFTLETLDADQYYRVQGQKGYQTISVALKDGPFTHYRRILVNEETVDLLSKQLQKVEAYRNAYTQLPESIVSIRGFTSRYNQIYETPAEMQELYSAIRTDVEALGFEKWYSLVNGHYVSEYEPIDTLNVQLIQNLYWYYFNVPLYPSQMPNTCNAVIRAMNRNISSEIDTLLDHIGWTDSVSLTLYNAPLGTDGYYFAENSEISRFLPEISQWLQDQVASQSYAAIDTTKPFFGMEFTATVQTTDKNDNTISHYTRYLWFFQPTDGVVPSWLNSENRKY